MNKAKGILPDKINIGDIYNVKIPLFQLPMGTLVLVYQIDENGIRCITEGLFTFYVGFAQNDWNSLEFFQRTGIPSKYFESEFQANLKETFYESLFIKFKSLSSLN